MFRSATTGDACVTQRSKNVHFFSSLNYIFKYSRSKILKKIWYFARLFVPLQSHLRKSPQYGAYSSVG